nr:MAG TPA: hypothetical protein [Bacteriophage sp.]
MKFLQFSEYLKLLFELLMVFDILTEWFENQILLSLNLNLLL